MTVTLTWLRRDLRLHDHGALAAAFAAKLPVQPVFVFDSDILAQFPAKDDRRLSFLAARLCQMDAELRKRGGGLLVLHGSAGLLIPKLAAALGAQGVTAAEDYEAATRARDMQVGKALGAQLRLVQDHVIFAPDAILRDGEAPYKVFTPYSKAWKEALAPAAISGRAVHDKGRYADFDAMRGLAAQAGLAPIDLSQGAAHALAQVGYTYHEDRLWTVHDVPKRLRDFLAHKAKGYKDTRDIMGMEGTSRLSPYIRFGLVSIRECVQGAVEMGADTWLNELIWREFYIMNLFHFPESAHMEWNPKYRDVLEWSQDASQLAAWKEGRTGYPLVDAAMRQLLEEGWMHNRARMVVASFLTKHLRTDWRLGEAHFAQYLMDYEQASNVGGWQWAASTGTDAQPYFRVFNPTLQSERFDAKGDYIRRYVPELAKLSAKEIHAPWMFRGAGYIPPIVEHAKAREAALAMFKKVP